MDLVDYEWVLTYLEEARDLLGKIKYDPRGPTLMEGHKAVQEFNTRLLHLRSVVSQIVPGLEKSLDTSASTTNVRNRRALDQAIYSLKDGSEVMRRLGPPPGPTLRADTFHPIVWDAAKSFWRSNHRAAAVDAASRAVNAMMQDKLGRRDISGTTLAEQAFSPDLPPAGRSRLRLRDDVGSETYRSVHLGAMRFGAGCFLALRNPVSHEGDELEEQAALEQLAAFSIFARWVEAAQVISTPKVT